MLPVNPPSCAARVLPCIPLARQYSSESQQPSPPPRLRSVPVDPNSPTVYATYSSRPFLPRLTTTSDPFGFSADGREGRPTDIAYFTGNPSYYSAVLILNDAIRKCGLDFKDKTQYEGSALPVWMKKEEMQTELDAQLSAGKYEEIVHKLSILYANRDRDPLRLSDEFFASYVRPGALFRPKAPEPPAADEHGRVFAQGSRKTSRARVLLIPGDGEMYVNGVRFGDYFKDRIGGLDGEVLKVFGVAGVLGQYNVWAEAQGGGLTGQLGALQLAIARALIVFEPSKALALQAAGYLTPDTRQVERKKTNLAKARKRYTWVKR
ncbi:37S ribosomal protein S9, mitochondrial [Gonapodya sp. JEL0774]|nr:37S ribosomal protein S9, mitochondrial [Gonapodya sp. JEL0774]